MAPIVTIYMVRHGEVDMPRGVLYGQKDVPLSRSGMEQTRAAARFLSGLRLDRVVSSDLSRAWLMALELERLGGPRPERFEELREVDFGQWSGLTWEDIEERWPGAMENRYSDLVNYRPPGGENIKDLLRRALKVVEPILKGERGSRVGLIAHGGIIKVLTSHAIGLDLNRIFNLHLDYASVNRIDSWPDGISVLKFANRPAL